MADRAYETTLDLDRSLDTSMPPGPGWEAAQDLADEQVKLTERQLRAAAQRVDTDAAIYAAAIQWAAAVRVFRARYDRPESGAEGQS